TGTTFKAISVDILKNSILPLPPLAEQQRIVTKIEEMFSSVDQGIEKLKKVRGQIKMYRQSVLKAAFEGRLVNGSVYKDLEVLKTSRSETMRSEQPEPMKSEGSKKSIAPLTEEEISELPILPKDWKWVKLGEVCEKITDGEHFRPPTQETGIPFLSAKDVRDNGVSFDDPLFISEQTAAKALQRCNPELGDLLIVSRGATVGRMCIVNTDRKFCLLGSVILIKVIKSISSGFLNYSLKSPFANQRMIAVSGATAQQAIYLRDIQGIPIPLPPSLAVQNAIVDAIESRLSKADLLDKAVEDALQKAEQTKQSILKKAFRGELV
ncbi:MAG TPA: restriction endonuclease subunit S, partial [Leptospiraceae bacterium]|nr:restriction endonuclease subunit S [Leptospiraceae bacterium]